LFHLVLAGFPIVFSDIFNQVPSKITDTTNAAPEGMKPGAPLRDDSEARRFAESLRQIVDRHALLIMRELSMGVTRFQEIEAQTKIGASLLSSRLRRLERDGIIGRRLYSSRPPRYEYFATPKGRGLDAVLFAAGNWSIRWGDQTEEPSITVYDKVTGKRLSASPRRRASRRKSPKSTK
jgi:DNA-binding HxlR family transcriptional regulator